VPELELRLLPPLVELVPVEDMDGEPDELMPLEELLLQDDSGTASKQHIMAQGANDPPHG
jgi:hypothetical protein